MSGIPDQITAKQTVCGTGTWIVSDAAKNGIGRFFERIDSDFQSTDEEKNELKKGIEEELGRMLGLFLALLGASFDTIFGVHQMFSIINSHLNDCLHEMASSQEALIRRSRAGRN